MSLKNASCELCGLVAIAVVVLASSALAQTTSSSVLPTGGGKMLLDPNDTVLLLLDYQAGLFQTVKDVPVDDLRGRPGP